MIILDTNAVIYSIKQKIEIEKFISEDIAVPSSVIEELTKLKDRNIHAKVALEKARQYRIIRVEDKGDDGVIEAAIKYNAKVLTNDRQLRKLLKDRAIGSLSITRGMVRE